MEDGIRGCFFIDTANISSAIRGAGGSRAYGSNKTVSPINSSNRDVNYCDDLL